MAFSLFPGGDNIERETLARMPSAEQSISPLLDAIRAATAAKAKVAYRAGLGDITERGLGGGGALNAAVAPRLAAVNQEGSLEEIRAIQAQKDREEDQRRAYEASRPSGALAFFAGR